MPDIRVLPELITNQIAAGEVVERPVSVVKELMENALDANARHIQVEVERGGRDLIRVSDDGHGMSRDNALLSIERYATSKIAAAKDLFSISTLGFRGEALPSMASVSRMTIITRERTADYGTRLFISGGKLMEVAETGAPPGTVVEVKNLYFNTPVRRKFLKTVATEMGHIADAFSAMAMAAEKVGFSLVHNGRPVKEIPADLSLKDRVAAVLSTDADLTLYPVAGREGGVRVDGFISHPAHTRAGSQRIRIFVNGRMITDRGAVSALVQGYRGRLMKGRFPLGVLFIRLPNNEVDVNVHPAKLQVRFVNETAVYRCIRQCVVQALEAGENKALAHGQEKTDFAHGMTAKGATPGEDSGYGTSHGRTPGPNAGFLFDHAPGTAAAGEVSERGPVPEGRPSPTHGTEKPKKSPGPDLFQWGGPAVYGGGNANSGRTFGCGRGDARGAASKRPAVEDYGKKRRGLSWQREDGNSSLPGNGCVAVAPSAGSPPPRHLPIQWTWTRNFVSWGRSWAPTL